MKKIVILLLSILFAQGISAQTVADSISNIRQRQLDTMKVQLLTRISQHTGPCFKLYPTENMWTFLELDTSNGRIWQVQYSTTGPDYRFRSTLNEDSLVWNEDYCYAGRFELYKTQNMYNFILLDTYTGSTWQVQWSTDRESRMILPID